MRYFVGFLITIGLIILLIVLLLGGGGNKSKVPNSSRTLESYANTDATVSMLVDGPVNADQSHNQIQITVSRDDTTYEQLKGYNNTVVNTRTYGNNEASYSAFLYSLDHAGFTKGNTASDLKNETGYCPQGDRYVFELTQDGKTIERYWATSCGSPKSYAGSLNLTIALFNVQVPDFSTLSGSVSL